MLKKITLNAGPRDPSLSGREVARKSSLGRLAICAKNVFFDVEKMRNDDTIQLQLSRRKI